MAEKNLYDILYHDEVMRMVRAPRDRVIELYRPAPPSVPVRYGP